MSVYSGGVPSWVLRFHSETIVFFFNFLSPFLISSFQIGFHKRLTVTLAAARMFPPVRPLKMCVWQAGLVCLILILLKK